MDARVDPVSQSSMRRFALVLLALAAVPDVLPYAGLKTLIGERFGIGDAQTQLFALAALFGALLALPLLARARRAAPRMIFGSAALIQAIVIASMAFPIEWWMMLALRVVQGAVDLLLLATLTTLVASSARSTARGFGASGAAIMIGLATGLVAGGILASQIALLVFPAAATVSLGLALAARGLPATPITARRASRGSRDLQVMTGGAFAASDRMISGMLTVGFPLLLAASFGASPTVVGLILAAPLLACAAGGFTAGVLVERIGALPARLIGVPLQAAGVALIAFSGGAIALLALGTLGLALGAVLLLPTSLVIGAGQRPEDVDTEAVGGIQAIGQAGHLVGTVLVFGLTAFFGAVTPGGVLAILAIYLVWNGVWFLRARASTIEYEAAGTDQELLPRRAMVPINARARRPRTTSLIDSREDAYPERSLDSEDTEDSTECPSTNTNAQTTAKS